MKRLIVIFFYILLIPRLLIASDNQTSSFILYEYDLKNASTQNTSDWIPSKLALPDISKIQSLDIISQGDYILLFGLSEGDATTCGRKKSNPFFIRYSLSNGHSTALPISDLNRVEAKLIAYDDGILVWGGRSKDVNSNDCNYTTLAGGDFYSFASNAWIKINPPPVTFNNPQILRRDNSSQILFWGESEKSKSHSGTGYILSLKDGLWHEIKDTSVPLPKYVYSATSNRDSAFLWSPSSDLGCISTGALYSFDQNVWKYTPDLNSPFTCLRPLVATSGDSVLIWGGKYRDQIVNNGSILNLKDLSWQKLSTEGSPMIDLDRNQEQYRSLFNDHYFTLVKIEEPKTNEFACSGYLYNRAKDSWEQLPTTPKKLPPEHLLTKANFGLDKLNPTAELRPYYINFDDKGIDFCGYLQPIPEGISESALFQINGKVLLLTWKKLI